MPHPYEIDYPDESPTSETSTPDAFNMFFEQVSAAAGLKVSPPEQSLVIWKYPLAADYDKPFTLTLPVGAKFCAMAVGLDGFLSWFLVDPDAEKETRRFLLTGTNHPIAGFVAYLDNIKQLTVDPDGPVVLVTHLLEVQ